MNAQERLGQAHDLLEGAEADIGIGLDAPPFDEQSPDHATAKAAISIAHSLIVIAEALADRSTS